MDTPIEPAINLAEIVHMDVEVMMPMEEEGGVFVDIEFVENDSMENNVDDLAETFSIYEDEILEEDSGAVGMSEQDDETYFIIEDDQEESGIGEDPPNEDSNH